MPKLNDLNVKMNVTTTFSTDAYRDALYVALGEAAALRERVGELESAAAEREATPMLSVSYAPAEHDAAAHRKLADIIDEWRGLPVGATSPVTGRVRTGDAEVDSLTGIPSYARKVMERLALDLNAKREENAVLHARNEDLTRTMHDVAASKDQEIARVIGEYGEVRGELSEARVALDTANRTLATATDDLNAAQGEVEQLRDEVTSLRAACAVHEEARRSLRQEVQDFLSGMNEQTDRAVKLEEMLALASEANKELRGERDEALQSADLVNRAYDGAQKDLHEEIARYQAMCTDHDALYKEYVKFRDLYQKYHDEYASMVSHCSHVERLSDQRWHELDAARANLEAMRAEVVRLQDRLDQPQPATRFISAIGPKDLQGAYERGVEEGRAAAIDEADGIAHALTGGARSVMRERAIQRAKYTHTHDARHPGEEWLGLMEDTSRRYAVRDWPRVFRVIGALAIAALDVLTAEGNDWLLKKDMEIIAATDHVSAEGSSTPPETDHAAEGLAHQPSPAVPMTVAADDIPTVPDPVYPERTRHLADGELVVTRRDCLLGSRVVRGATDVWVVSAGNMSNVMVRLQDGYCGLMPRENLIPTT